MMSPSIHLTEQAQSNAFATMLAELVGQNLASKPHKVRDFRALASGEGVSVALVADDADVALTLEFCRGQLTVHDGIYRLPDVTVRATAEVIMAMSNMPLTTRLALPVPTDRASLDVVLTMAKAMNQKQLQIFGGLAHGRAMSRLMRVMSVNG